MEHRRQKHETWVSVPQFGDWDLRRDVPGYFEEFSEISETRKQNKRDASRATVGNGAELSLSITSNNPSKAVPEGAVSSASKGKPSQAKSSGGVSSGPKSETANPKPRGKASSPLNSEPTKASPSGRVSSRSENKPSTTISRQRSSSIFSYLNCCTKP